MNRLLSYILSCLLVSSCVSHDELLDYALEQARSNRHEIEKVLTHYADDAQKQEAACWLVANMPGHSVMWSEGIQAFADSVMHQGLPQERGNQLWDSLQKISATPQKQRDIETLSAEFLIDNIDKAFLAWSESPWKSEVDFDRFKKYVLPYRADNELLRIGWRDSLRATYAPVIRDAKTAREAFECLRKAVNSVKRKGKYDFPYVMDAVALRNHYSGVCLERCVYFTAVCRAFGLPVVIDNCGQWANYSNRSHTWVALVLDDGTYTVVDEDSVAIKFNKIDASTFAQNQTMPEDYPYTGEFKKRLVKVWRQTFDLNPIDDAPLFDDSSARLSSPRLVDVSAEYGLNGKVEIKPDCEIEDVWLCSHSLSGGWIPQAHAQVKMGKAMFELISDSVMLLPMGIIEDVKTALGEPFYISNGRKIELNADTTKLVSATFTRKYPINAGWLNRYAQIPSTRLEGCNEPSFQHPDTLFTITEVPVFYNTALIDSPGRYRYIRVIADLPSYANMDRLDIYDKTGTLVASEKKRLLDLGTPKTISRIDYFPWNDGNFVVPGHDYELAYWHKDRWRAIGRQHSNDYSLTFDNIPSGAHLILHDLTEGKEERPFTLNNGRQIWW